MQVSCLLFFCLAIAYAAAFPTPSSSEGKPCTQNVKITPDLGEKKYTAEIPIWTPHVIHGFFLTFTFDKEVKELTAQDDFVVEGAKYEFGVNNKDLTLDGTSTKFVRITVKYAGAEAPKLIGYKINGVAVCAKEDKITLAEGLHGVRGPPNKSHA